MARRKTAAPETGASPPSPDLAQSGGETSSAAAGSALPPPHPPRTLEAITTETTYVAVQLDKALRLRALYLENEAEIVALQSKAMALRGEYDAAFAAATGQVAPAMPEIPLVPPAPFAAPRAKVDQVEDLSAVDPRIKEMLAAQHEMLAKRRPRRPSEGHYWDDDAEEWFFDPSEARRWDARNAAATGKS